MKRNIWAMLIMLFLPMAGHADPLLNAFDSLGALKFHPSQHSLQASYQANPALESAQAEMNTLVKDVTPGVVAVNVRATLKGPNDALNAASPVDSILNPGQKAKPLSKAIAYKTADSSGSGFIVGADSQGRTLVVTNAHVVDIAGQNGKTALDRGNDVPPILIDVSMSQIIVIASDGSKHPATLIGYSDKDNGYDLALLRLNDACPSCKAVELADDNNVFPGDTVIAVGNPLNYPNTATQGVVSSANRAPVGWSSLIGGYIQSSADVNHGNSGGPLFNIHGQVIGVNDWIDSDGGAVGLSFAIPVRFVQNMLARYGRTNTFSSSDTGFLAQNNSGSITITKVVSKDMYAQGLREQDVIISVDGHTFSDELDLMRYLADKVPGEQAVFMISRNGAAKQVPVTMKLMW